jgi:hypothetical protein
MNTRVNLISGSVPDPHPCSLDPNTLRSVDEDDDYEAIINCCQKHVCRPTGYCKSTKKASGCRFDYPKECPIENTYLRFDETKKNVRAEIVLKRNDKYLNVHNRLLCHHWRANVDMQIILDISAAISYMVKYATKGKSNTNEYFLLKENL